MKHTFPKYAPEKSRHNLREFSIDQKGGVQFTRWQRFVNRYSGDFTFQTKVNMIASVVTGFAISITGICLVLKAVEYKKEIALAIKSLFI